MNEINNTRKITAIVCALNEEKTIRGVMDILFKSPLIDEVIAVDDGSTDKTAQILEEYQHLDQVEIILLPENHGKGYGMSLAAERARGEVLCFVDADLVNLSESHIAMMIETFISEEADMLLGSPVRGKTISFAEKLDPFLYLTGERVLYCKDFLQLSDEISTSGYGVETILNRHYHENGKRVHLMFLPDLIHPVKFEKTNLVTALGGYLQEGMEILAIQRGNKQVSWPSRLFTDHRNLN
jgi:glycosyltransferase involved in cell wall biosynthesis